MGVSPVSPLPPRATIEILKTDIVRRAVGRLADIQRSFRKTGETPMILFARRQARAVLKTSVPCSERAAICKVSRLRKAAFLSTAVNFWESFPDNDEAILRIHSLIKFGYKLAKFNLSLISKS